MSDKDLYGPHYRGNKTWIFEEQEKKCEGRRAPPCGRGSNCEGFKRGNFRCGGHSPVEGCSRKKAAAHSPKKSHYLGIPLGLLDPTYREFLKLTGEI